MLGLNGIVLWANITFAVTFTLLFVWTLKKGGNIFIAVVSVWFGGLCRFYTLAGSTPSFYDASVD